MEWNASDQPPEFWNQFKTDFAPGTHVRIHPLLHWTEINVWEYIERENIPIIPLYFDDGPATGTARSAARRAPGRSSRRPGRSPRSWPS